MNTLEYVAGLFRAEAGRLRGEVDPGIRLSGAVAHQDHLAASLDRMAGKVEQTAQSGLVEEVV